MDLEVAQQLGLVPPASGATDAPSGGTPPSSSQSPGGQPPAGDGLLGAQRYANEEGSPPPETVDTPPGSPTSPGSVEERLAALEQENQQLRARAAEPLPEDPYAAAQAYVTQRSQEIETQALAAYNGMLANEVAQGTMTAEHALDKARGLRDTAILQTQLEGQMIANLPANRLELANRIAKEFTVGEIAIAADEILTYAPKGPEAMRAAAQVLQQQRRDAAYQKRTTQGTDRAEGGASSTSVDPRVLDQLSPGQVIKLGIQRGHFA
jgi:hypothetical protein